MRASQSFPRSGILLLISASDGENGEDENGLGGRVAAVSDCELGHWPGNGKQRGEERGMVSWQWRMYCLMCSDLLLPQSLQPLHQILSEVKIQIDGH